MPDNILQQGRGGLLPKAVCLARWMDCIDIESVSLLHLFVGVLGPDIMLGRPELPAAAGRKRSAAYVIPPGKSSMVLSEPTHFLVDADGMWSQNLFVMLTTRLLQIDSSATPTEKNRTLSNFLDHRGHLDSPSQSRF